MFEAEQRFRFAIAILLFQESAKRKPPIMPDNCSWTKSDDPAGLLNSPAKIDIVPSLVVLGIETAYAFVCPAIKGHVTAWDVLGDCVGKQYMTRAAGRRCNTCLNPILCRWRDVRSTHSGVIAAYERADQIIEPVHVRHAVGIGVGQHVALGRGGSGVAGVTQSVIALVNVAHPGKLRGNVCRVVSRTVIDQNHFILRIIEFA